MGVWSWALEGLKNLGPFLQTLEKHCRLFMT